MARMRVALLGPLHVSLDSQPVTNFGYDKVRALLAYLLVEGDRPLQRDALATLLWPDAPAGAARKSLRTALAILRQAIGDATAQPPVLQIDRDTIQRNPHADVVLDVTELRAHLAAVERHAHATGLICVDCADRLARAVELYRGAFLQQISMPDSVAWEEWALLIRERLHGQLLDALAQLMVYHEARGEDEQVRQYAWRALAQEAWDEAAHRCLMRVYARGGQRSAALAQYERCRKLLANELGVALAAETTALYERIRSGPLERVAGIPPARHSYPNATPVIDAPSQRPPTRASNVPIPPTPLIGRADAVAAAAMRLRQPDGRLLTLIGPPGVGKTRLGLAVAQALRDDFADGVHFVALAPIRDPALVASALAHVLGLKKVGDQPYTEILRAFLQSKSLLLLLDNFEHLLEAAPLLAHLLSSCAHLKVLVTSRAALQLRAERRCPVAPLALPDSTQQPALAAMASAPSIALFVERAQAVAPAFTLSDANASTIAAICARLDGLPLAIELAAGRLSLMTPATLLAQLTQQLSVLDNGARDLPVHQRTLRTAIGWSYELLPAQAQRLLRCIGVFAGGCTWEALAAVSDSAADGMHMLMEGVETLVYQNLVQSDTTSDDDRRFTVFEAIREYALERLAQSDEIELLQRRHAAYYLTLAETAAPELEGPTQASWLKRLEAEHNNMRAALQWALDQGEREVALRFGVALRMFWHVHCYHSEGQRLLETALAMPHQTDDLLHAEALRCAALLANAKDDFDRAQILFEKSLTICQDLDDPRSIMRARYGLAHVAEAQGNAALAYHLYEESLAWNRDAHDEPGAAWALKNLGSMHLFWFVDPVTAARYIEESLQLFRKTENMFGIADALLALGDVYVFQGKFGVAQTVFEEALATSQQLEDTWGIGEELRRLGYVAHLQGNDIKAYAMIQHGLRLARNISGMWERVAFLVDLADVFVSRLPVPATRLLSAVEMALKVRSLRMNFILQSQFERVTDVAHAHLDEATFVEAWSTGSALTLDQAIAEALSIQPDDVTRPDIRQQPPERGDLLAGVPASSLPTLPAAEQKAPLIDGPTTLPSSQVPVPLTPLLGRQDDLTTALALLQRPIVRLLTLIGPPGVGKTRLALALAVAADAAFIDGVVFLALAAISNTALVLPTIAQALNVREVADQSLGSLLAHHLREKQLLLVLDNFEQIVAAAPELAELLTQAPGLKILATSRVPLRVSGEHEYAVQPLPVPAHPPALDVLAENPAVALFVQRASAVNHAFMLMAENAPVIATICARLDGLPLAIELAARRSKLFSPQVLLQRLDDRLTLLTNGARDLPPHQQTLRSTIAWSYELLSAAEQMLFLRLAVFVGGWTEEAAIAVCIGDFAIDVLNGLATLLDHSLIQRTDGIAEEPRFTMLETLREYALERFTESGEAETLRHRHMTYYLNFAERAEPQLTGTDQRAWLNQLEQDHDNLRAALAWTVDHDLEGALRLGGALADFWLTRGHRSEGRQWLEYMLARAGASTRDVTELTGTSIPALPTNAAARVKALHGAGILAGAQDDDTRAEALFVESLELAREIGDVRRVALILNNLACVVFDQGDAERAVPLFAEALVLARAADDQNVVALVLHYCGNTAVVRGDFQNARSCFEESLALRRLLDDQRGIARSLTALGELALEQGEVQRAVDIFAEGLALARAIGDQGNIAWLFYYMGRVMLAQHNLSGAMTKFMDSARLNHMLGFDEGVALSLANLAAIAVQQQDLTRAARLLGAVEARRTPGLWLAVTERAEYESNLAAVRTQLDQATFATAWATGSTLTLDEAIAQALIIGDKAQDGWLVRSTRPPGRRDTNAMPHRPELFTSTQAGTTVPSAMIACEEIQPSISATSPNSTVPVPLTPLFGRQLDLTTAQTLLQRSSVRLLTLVGPPGVGKTRLALALAATMDNSFADGVVFVALAAIHDPVLVLSAIAQALNVHEVAHQSLLTLLAQYLHEKHLLLVLDNVEQLIVAVPQLTGLLTHAPGLKILATSRVPLRISGEHEYAVHPLPIPDPARLPPLDALTENPAVALFVQCATALNHAFTLTTDNAPTVATICARLDGLPLAIELAAARSKLFNPQALLQRLDHRLALLTGGARDRPLHQRTLRHTIAWSYDLLSAAEQTFFRRLAVFVGGWTEEAAGAICMSDGAAPIDVIDGLTTLLDHSLIRLAEGVASEPRYTMFETIREYALEQLEASGELADVQQQHIHYYLVLAETAELALDGPEQVRWIERLEIEHDNLRTALTGALTHSEGDTALRIVGALGRFWFIYGHLSEGRRWMDAALVQSDGLLSSARARVLHAAGILAFTQGEYATATMFGEQSLSLYRITNNTPGVATALGGLGIMALAHGNTVKAAIQFEEAVTLYQELDDMLGIATSLIYQGKVAYVQGDVGRAAELFAEALALFRTLGNGRGIAWSLNHLGDIARLHHTYDQAAAYYQESLQLCRNQGDKGNMAVALHSLGYVTLTQNDIVSAITFFEESLGLYQHLGNKVGIAVCLAGFAEVAVEQGRPTQAASLLGLAATILDSLGGSLEPVDRAEYERNIAVVHSQLDDVTFASAWAAGRALTLEQPIAIALRHP